MRGVLTCFGTREWRNRQTRWLQVPVPARAWGFNSPLAHKEEESPSFGENNTGEGLFFLIRRLFTRSLWKKLRAQVEVSSTIMLSSARPHSYYANTPISSLCCRG